MLSQYSLDADFISDLSIWNTPFDTLYLRPYPSDDETLMIGW